MTPLPPKYHQFLTCPNGLASPVIPSPVGLSLVTSHFYIKFFCFYENTHHRPDFMNPRFLRQTMEHTLNYFYPLTGRLIVRENSRYDIGHFDRGGLMEMVDSVDTFKEYKECRYSYSVVPYDELLSLQSFVSKESPLFGVRVTYLKCGSVVMGYSIHHKMMDGSGCHLFLDTLCKIGRQEYVDPSVVKLYFDGDRSPLRSLPGVDHSLLYPYTSGSMQTSIARKTRIVTFSFDQQKLCLIQEMINEEAGYASSLSKVICLLALMYKSVIRARQVDNQSLSDLICIISKRHKHKDERMKYYFGNHILPVICSHTKESVMKTRLCDLAVELSQKIESVDIPYIESLECYLNQAENVHEIMRPFGRLAMGAIGVSDWSRFIYNSDMSYGSHSVIRSYLDPSPFAIGIILPASDGLMDVAMQLDNISMDKLLTDPQFIQYVTSVW
ncbi:transferase [Pilobolus umbonatus]|nr:transferase [Pilobolus umbonatus]